MVKQSIFPKQDRNWRYPAVIQKVVSDWTTLTFNWDDKLTGTNQPDQGVQVGRNGRIPTMLGLLLYC